MPNSLLLLFPSPPSSLGPLLLSAWGIKGYFDLSFVGDLIKEGGRPSIRRRRAGQFFVCCLLDLLVCFFFFFLVKAYSLAPPSSILPPPTSHFDASQRFHGQQLGATSALLSSGPTDRDSSKETIIIILPLFADIKSNQQDSLEEEKALIQHLRPRAQLLEFAHNQTCVSSNPKKKKNASCRSRPRKTAWVS